ncbi:MAG: hypothetical protein HZA50_08115 [Planctomycetes bacterium]|nr:hypothetical protein [Planctomycetota bacterium]
MKIACPYCRKVLRAKPDAVGKKLMCPGCERIFKLRPFNIISGESGEHGGMKTPPPGVFDGNKKKSDTHFGLQNIIA